MKKIALALGMIFSVQLMAQLPSRQIMPILVPQFAATTKSGTGDTTRTPIIFRLRLNQMKANTKYRYIVKASNWLDIRTNTLSVGGAGNAIFIDTLGNFKYGISPNLTSSGFSNDTFQTDIMGDYEGWFGILNTSNARFAAGKYIYPIILAVSISGNDTFKNYCTDSIKMIDYGSSSSQATLIWGSSMAKDKSFVVLYDAINPLSVRPLSIAMIENIEISSLWKAYLPYTVKNKVQGVAGNWATFIPNDLSSGLKRVENFSLQTGNSLYANTDPDGIWGPSKKSTLSTSGGSSSPIYLSNDDAPLVQPKIEFWLRNSSTKEDIGIYKVFVSRKYSNDKDQTVRFFVAGGTASKGTTNDFTVAERTLTFKGSGAAGYDTSVITINDDNSAEGTESIVLGIDQPMNCVIGVEKAHTIDLIDNDIANIIIPNSPIVVKENAGRIGIILKMDKSVSTASKIMLALKRKGDSTYIPAEFQLGKNAKDSTFMLGKSTKADSLMIYAKVFDDFDIDFNDTVILVVRQLTGSAYLKDSLITLVMTDNDGPANIEFIDTKLTVTEKVGTVLIRIRVASRSDADADFTLRCYTALSSAIEGTDFSFNPTSKIITVSSSTPDTIVVKIPFYDDNNFELIKKVYFGLGNLSNSIITKGKDTLIITLLNDDLPIYKIGTVNKQSNALKSADSLNVRCRVYGTVYGMNMRTVGMNFTIMDNTGGMGVFNTPKTFGYTVTEGDSLMIQGTVNQFQGLVQIDKLDTIIKISSGASIKKPLGVSVLNESTESNLVSMRRLKLVDATEWPSIALAPNAFKNVRVMNTSGRVDTLNIDAETDIDGNAAPQGYFDVKGIGSQFDNSSPFTSRYVLTPRSIKDFNASTLPTVNFSKTTDQIFEPADSFRMDFSINPTDENFSFDVAIKGGTAVSPTDYDFATRKLNIVKNVGSFFIRANISDDGDPDGDKLLIFVIRNAQGPCFIGNDSMLTLSIKDNEASVVKRFESGQIKMYPNPASGLVTIESVMALKSLHVYTLSGQLIRTIAVQNGPNHLGNGRNISFVLNEAPGLYRVQAITETGAMFSDFLGVQ